MIYQFALTRSEVFLIESGSRSIPEISSAGRSATLTVTAVPERIHMQHGVEDETIR
jgi:hypothetical protein